MKNFLLPILLSIFFVSNTFAQETDSIAAFIENIEKSLKYETGKIKLTEGEGTLTVPKGFKFLDGKQTQYVLKDIWGNPEDTKIIGSLVPEGKGVTNAGSWMFVINYQGDGYVEDDDAEDIDYDELLETMKEDIKIENEERVKNGFEAVQLVGWGSKPYYDSKLKVLHWAKELKFGKDEANTLNYDLRVLGRKGMYNISAVAGMSELNEVKMSIPSIIKSVEFNEGNGYLDFDADTDTVAAWTIGGLVAGKVLAKVGFLAIIAKFGKIIIFAIIAGFAAAKKFLFGKKEQVVSKPVEEEVALIEEKKEEE